MIHIEFQARRPSFEGTVVTAPEGTRVSVNHDGREVSSINVCAEPPTSAKETFLAVCAEWADLLIGDSVRQKALGGVRWAETPDEMIPKVFYGKSLLDLAEIACSVLAPELGLPSSIREASRFPLFRGDKSEVVADLSRRFEETVTITELPESQKKVWRAAWQLLQDAWDAAPKPESK